MDVLPNRPFANLSTPASPLHPLPDPVGGVSLLPRRLPIRLQDLHPRTLSPPPASSAAAPSSCAALASALPIASRTIRRCTFSFFATPAIVPMPNSYSLRICSNSSTFALQSNEFLRFGLRPNQEYPFVERVGQNKLPKWASSEYRNQAGLPELKPLGYCLS